MFTENKFRSFDPAHQAKKIAELLAPLIEGPVENWKRQLVHYRDLCRWRGDQSHPLDPQTLRIRPLVEAYSYWRTQAGLGPEKRLWANFNQGDFDQPQQPPLPWKVWLHNLRSGHNVGSIIRSADGMGLSEIWLSGYSARPDNAAVRSAAMGAEQWFPHRSFDNGIPEVLEQAEKLSLPLIALETDPNAKELQQFDWPKEGLLIFGNEELGVDPQVLERVEHRIQIPMFGRKASLNVANAFALVAWELRRHHLMAK